MSKTQGTPVKISTRTWRSVKVISHVVKITIQPPAKRPPKKVKHPRRTDKGGEGGENERTNRIKLVVIQLTNADASCPMPPTMAKKAIIDATITPPGLYLTVGLCSRSGSSLLSILHALYTSALLSVAQDS